MPIEFLYLGVVFAVAVIGFMVLKRPLYECMLAAFIALVAVTGTWSNIPHYIWDALKEPTMYIIFVYYLITKILIKFYVIPDTNPKIIVFKSTYILVFI